MVSTRRVDAEEDGIVGRGSLRERIGVEIVTVYAPGINRIKKKSIEIHYFASKLQ